MAENLVVGTRVKCVAHGGRHRAQVARVIVENELYVLAWEGRGTHTVLVGNVRMKYPPELVKSHLLDLTSCEASKVERA